MKAGLNSIKRELLRLADLDTLKKELKRVATEIKNHEVHINLTPSAARRLEVLEQRFRDLLKRVSELQKQVEGNFEKFVRLVKKSTARKGKKSQRSAGKTSKKAAKKSSSKTKKQPRKTAI
jgi:hypothetical protein